MKNGSGVLAAVDLDGNVKWARNIGYNGGHSSVASPCLLDARLFVWNAVSNGATHVLTCYDAKDGTQLWQTEPRPAGGGAGCASPVILRLKGVPVVLTACADIVRAADGKILAREVHPQGFSTPPYHDDVVFFGLTGVVAAVRLNLDGEKVTSTKLWTARPRLGTRSSGMYGGQVYYQGYVYMLQATGEFSIINAATGEIVHTLDAFPGKGTDTYANLSVAGGKVYGFDRNGRGLVVRAGPKDEVIARNDCMGGGPGSAFFVGNRIYLRNCYKKWMPNWVYCLEGR